MSEIKFDVASWVEGGASVRSEGLAMLNAVLAKVAELDVDATGAPKGATLADTVIAGLLPCVAAAMTEMAESIQSALGATGELMEATGTMYNDTENGNAATAASMTGEPGE